MLSEEEKKSIEVFKEILFERDKINEIEDEEEREIEKSAYFEEMAFDEIEIVLNLIEKQQKEIEELKNADLTTVYLNGFYDGEKKVKDKIKAKIEELEKQQKEEPDAYLCIKVLRSLLEKE